MRRALFADGIEWRGGIGAEHYDFCLQVQRSKWQAVIESTVRVDHDRAVDASPDYLRRRLDYADAQQWLLETWDTARLIQDGKVICTRSGQPQNEPLHLETEVAQHFVDESYFGFERPEVMSLVPASARRILEIGCGAGKLGAAIKRRQNARVVGVEVDSSAAKVASSRLDSVLNVDIESVDWPFDDSHFDCIIVADVLEHLRQPERILRLIRKSMAPDGVLVASLPNTRNHAIVSGLIQGHWTYEAAGLLDNTHLRFFTKREIEKTLYRTGYEITSWNLVPDGTHERWMNSADRTIAETGPLKIQCQSAADAEEFFTYQFLFTAQPHTRYDYGLTSIIVLTYNQLAYTRMCLDSIRMRTDEPYELIVVDNGSTDGTVAYLRSLRGVRVIENQENRGFPAGVNQGLAVAQGEQCLLLNNDTIVTTGWLRRMLECLHSDPCIGLVGPTSNCVSGVQCIPVAYDDIGKVDGFAWDRSKACETQQVETDRLVGFCLLIRRTVLNDIGFLDERFGIGTFEDDDYCLRAIRAGYRCVVSWQAFVHHFGSKSFQAMGDAAQALLERNQQAFEAKWHVNETGRPITGMSSLNVTERCELPTEFAICNKPDGSIVLSRVRRSLSLCMIVRDNERTIKAALESIRPWVDEMIVVDTGSKDCTRELVLDCGAKLFHFPWCDDFAAARNESLKHASGDWIFWMDSDDTIDVGNGRKLRELSTGAISEGILGYVMQVHCPGLPPNQECDVTVVDHVKMFRNLPELRFEGRIHEQILPAIRAMGGRTEWTDIFVRHSGAASTVEACRQKQERDLRILQIDLLERPNHPFVLFNLGMTYADMAEHAEAIAYLEKCLEASEPTESHVRKAYSILIGSLNAVGRHPDAFEACEEARRLFPSDPELLFREGVLAHQAGDLDRAENAYLLAIEDSNERFFSSIDRGITGFKARHNLALVYEDMGDLPKAAIQWTKVVTEMPAYRAGWQGLVNNSLRRSDLARVETVISQMRGLGRSLRPEVVRAEFARSVHLGDLQRARRELDHGLREFDTDETLTRTACEFYFNSGLISDAIECLLKLANIAPDDATVYHNLGSCYLMLHDPRSALTAFDKALQIRPSDANSLKYRRVALGQLAV